MNPDDTQPLPVCLLCRFPMDEPAPDEAHKLCDNCFEVVLEPLLD